MKAAPFDYVRASTIDDVCRLLQTADGEARIIAGGQSLVPLMAARLARIPIRFSCAICKR